MERCKKCGNSLTAHQNDCPDARHFPEPDPEYPYQPPFINRNGFLQMDLRSWHWSRTRVEARKLLFKE